MEKQYSICGLKVLCDFRYPMMTDRAEKYLCPINGDADIMIPHEADVIKDMQTKNPHLSLNECEVIRTTYQFYGRLLKFGGFMLHSSAVAVDNSAYLFSAPSGTGKSTHTQQWLKLFGDRAEILNDDKPAVMIKDGKVFACGTPWSGKSDMNVNRIVPLKGICVLERSEENHIEPFPSDKSLFYILNQTLRPTDPTAMDKLLELVDETSKQVRVWKMDCNISTQAAEIAYGAMSL